MDSFREKLDEIKRLIEEDVHRRRVLLLCQQAEPKSFDEYSSSGSFRRLEKFESSTYSEVLKAIDLADNNKPVVMKIMRALSRGVIKRMPSVTTKGCQAYNDILNELVVTQALSQLHDGVILNGQPNALYRTHFFCLIHEIKVVSGNLNRQLQTRRKRASPHIILSKSEPPSRAGRELARANTDTTNTANTSLVSSTALSQPPASSQASDTLGSSLATSSRAGLSTVSRYTGASTISSSASLSQRNTANTANSGGLDGAVKEAAAREGQKEGEQERSKEEQEEKPADEELSVAREDEMAGLPEEDRMLMESLPHEYVVSVMRHDGQPLWWMMTHKKLTPEQLASVLVQVIVGLAIAENVYLYEHRDLHVSNILIKRTTNEHIPFILDGQRYNIVSQGVKATIIDATFSRLTHNGKVYCRDLTSTLRAYGTRKTPTKMSLQNRSYRQMVRLTKNKWEEFTPKTNLIWLTYLCETLMKNDIMRTNAFLLNEVRKIRDYTLKCKTTFDLLACFPFEKASKSTSEPVPANGTQENASGS